MKKITMFYQTQCPFCKKALAYIDTLRQRDEFRAVEIEMIEENEQPELAAKFDYYYVPTFYIGAEKVHEGGIYPEEMEAVLRKALK